MHKRTIILITVCFLLVAATVTMRYIEREIKVIKAQFMGGKKIEERSTTNPAAARTMPRQRQSEDVIRSGEIKAGASTSASGLIQSPPRTTSVVGSGTEGIPSGWPNTIESLTAPRPSTLLQADDQRDPGISASPPVEDTAIFLASEGNDKGRAVAPAQDDGAEAEVRETGSPEADRRHAMSFEPNTAGRSDEQPVPGSKERQEVDRGGEMDVSNLSTDTGDESSREGIGEEEATPMEGAREGNEMAEEESGESDEEGVNEE